jgi:hypothetical protein
MKHIYTFENFLNEGEFRFHFISQNINKPVRGKFEGNDAIIFDSNSLAFELKGGRKGPGLKMMDSGFDLAGVELNLALNPTLGPKSIALYGSTEDLKTWIETVYLQHPASSTKDIGEKLYKEFA